MHSVYTLNKNIKHHLVFDGFGDDYITHTRYTITETKHGYSYIKDRSYHDHELTSLGVIMAEVARRWVFLALWMICQVN